MPKLLHITQDEKFIETANKQFQLIFPDSNDFYIITPNIENYELMHVKRHPNFKILKENKDSFKYIISQLPNYDLIILHNLDYFKSKIVLNTNKPVLWIYWGFEIYNYHKHLRNSMYGPKTLQIYSPKQKLGLQKKIRKFLFLIRSGRLNMKTIINKAAKKIEYFGSGIEEEYELLKTHNIINAKFFFFSYYNLDLYVTYNKVSHKKKNKILLGNSATATNNHLEAMDILKQLDYNDLKIIAPLNYGDMEYAKKISTTGKRLFGNNFEPLTTFIPLHEYNKILNECRIFIMNSYRQQGLGNIYSLLYLGAKVYLDERSLAYKYLKRIGCHVFSIKKDLIPENNSAFECLSVEKQDYNRQVFEREFESTGLNNKIRDQLMNIIEKE